MKLSVIDPPGVCIENKCTLDFNESFRLAVDIERPPIEGFILAQSRVEFGPHLTYTLAPTPEDEVVLEPCALRFHDLDEGAVFHACITGLPPAPIIREPATLAVFELTCSVGATSTAIEFVLDLSNGTLLSTPGFDIVEPDLTHVTVNCVQPGEGTPTPTPTHTDTPTPGGPDTPTPSDTPTGTLTPATATPTPSETPTGTLTPATATPTPSETPTGTLTPATATPAVTVTATVSGTPATPADTSTSTSVPSSTPTRRRSPLGDVNCDGIVDPVDAVFLLQLEAALIDALPCPEAGDVDEDGETTLIDAALILQFSAGLISSLPP